MLLGEAGLLSGCDRSDASDEQNGDKRQRGRDSHGFRSR